MAGAAGRRGGSISGAAPPSGRAPPLGPSGSFGSRWRLHLVRNVVLWNCPRLLLRRRRASSSSLGGSCRKLRLWKKYGSLPSMPFAWRMDGEGGEAVEGKTLPWRCGEWLRGPDHAGDGPRLVKRSHRGAWAWAWAWGWPWAWACGWDWACGAGFLAGDGGGEGCRGPCGALGPAKGPAPGPALGAVANRE